MVARLELIKELALIVPPDAQVDARTLDSRGQARERSGPQRERLLEQHRPHGPIGRQEGQGDFRQVALLALQARPEGGIHQGLDRRRIGSDRSGCLPGVGQVPREVLLDPRRVDTRGRVERAAHAASRPRRGRGPSARSRPPPARRPCPWR